MAEQLERVALQLGQENISKLQQATVLVVGVGGVGSYAIESLARSGVGHLRIVDHDDVERSNLNRQIMATYDTLGMNKCEAMKQRIATYNDKCIVEGHKAFFNEDSAYLLEGVDFVIDAIDTVTSKVMLYKMCLERNIPFISSLGMANRLDPSTIEVSELMKTSNDPLARAIRNRVRKEKLKGKIPVMMDVLLPLTFQVGSDVVMRVDELNASIQDEIHVTFEVFGNDVLRVTKVPAWMNHVDERKFLQDVLDNFVRDVESVYTRMDHKRIATMACHASIRFNHALTMQEMKEAILQLSQCENPYHCPHGRPTFIILNEKELTKEFLR